MRVHHAAAMLAAKTTVRAGPHKVACNSKTQVTQRCELKRTNKIAQGNCMRNCRRRAKTGELHYTGSDTPTPRQRHAVRGFRVVQNPHYDQRGSPPRCQTPTNWIGNDDLDRKITYPEEPFLPRRQLSIQNTRPDAGQHKGRNARGLAPQSRT